MPDFSTNVFINCPFDAEYRQLLLATIFTVKYLGFDARLSYENSTAGTARLEHIVSLIEESKYGIHDLSRIISNAKGEHARMNMPFELGIDYGCAKFRGGDHANKKILVLEKEPYSSKIALSDLAGSDTKYHQDDAMKLIKAVRDWFVIQVLRKGSSPKKIWFDFNTFTAYLEEQLVQHGHDEGEFEEVPILEVMEYMDEWIFENIILGIPEP